MANVTVAGASYLGVPAVDLPMTGGGTASFYETKSVTYNIGTGASVSADPSQVVAGQGFSMRMDAASGYNLSEVVITMGGVDITSQVFSGEYPDSGGGTYVRTEICPQQSFTGDSSQRRATLTGLTEGLTDGSYYIVTYDGTEWLTTCEEVWTGNFTIGASSLFFSAGDSVYPFGVVWVSGTTATVAADNTSQHAIKIEKLEFISSGVNLIQKSITANGTYTAASDSADGFSVVSVDVSGGGSPSLQTKTKSYTPTKSVQTEAISADSGYDGLDTVNISVAAIPSQYIIPEGTKSITANGTGIDVTSYASVDVAVPTGGTTKNIQVYSGYDETNSNIYVATDVSITVSKAGSYKCSWTGLRNTTSGTSGSQLYKNDSAVGSVHSSGWIRSYGQYCEEALTLAAGDVLTVYARARASNYYMVVGNLIIQEQ